MVSNTSQTDISLRICAQITKSINESDQRDQLLEALKSVTFEQINSEAEKEVNN